MKRWVAERKLTFAPKSGGERKELIVRIGEPYLLEQSSVNFKIHEGAAGCRVELHGLSEEYLEEVYGADSLQALQLASDVEPILMRLSKKYDFYFPTGEPYFEE